MTNTLISGNDSVQKHSMTEPASSSTSTPADEIAIRSLYQQLMDGWNKGSSEAFAPHLQKTVILLVSMVHTSMDDKISSPFISNSLIIMSKVVDLVGKARNVRFLTHDIAIMHVVGGTIMAGQTDIEPERNSVQTLVATKDSKGDGVWPHFKIQELSTLEGQSRLKR